MRSKLTAHHGRPVYVRECFAICAAAPDEARLWSALLAGQRALALHHDVRAEQAVWAARIPQASLPQGDRTLALCEAIADQLLASPALGALDRQRLGLALGTTQGAILRWQAQQRSAPHDVPGLYAPLLALRQRLASGGPLSCPSTGCTSGSIAIATAAQWIREGRCDAALAGGVDVVSEFVQAGFEALRALDPSGPRPFDATRAGTALGDGIGLLLLSYEPGADPVRLAGWGAANDANHLTGPDPQGSGLALAIRSALELARLDAANIDLLNAHGTGTRYNDQMECNAFHQLLGRRASQLPLCAIKGAIGHTLAAAGALEAACCVRSLREQRVPPTVGCEAVDPALDLDVVCRAPRDVRLNVALSTSAAFGGNNAALLFTR
ncbi:MAG: hypothetical protein H6707_05080 [Deltaproteobacteria bacterium]|nr:hypothetical protein [Deltaproteobacteria bacterium]